MLRLATWRRSRSPSSNSPALAMRKMQAISGLANRCATDFLTMTPTMTAGRVAMISRQHQPALERVFRLVTEAEHAAQHGQPFR